MAGCRLDDLGIALFRRGAGFVLGRRADGDILDISEGPPEPLPGGGSVVGWEGTFSKSLRCRVSKFESSRHV